MIVLVTLVTGMTVTAGVLRLLEPGPVAPLTGITLQSVEHDYSSAGRLFDTNGSSREWRAIVIHDSGRLADSARSLNHRHKQQGRAGLGYHFVINNGTHNKRDGAVEVGYRWQHQHPGDYFAPGPDADWFHEHAISICMIGDADRRSLTRSQLRELVWLVQKLQSGYDIPAEAVYVQVGNGRESLFPDGWFRDQLLARRVP